MPPNHQPPVPPPSSTTVTFLGTGTSVGVPVIGCDCLVCTSGNPRNTRTRCSLLVESVQTTVLIDSGPDLREQALREGLRKVDAVLYTHAHLDHIAGFDELRAFCWHRDTPLPLHAGPKTHAAFRQMFPWAFTHNNPGYVRPTQVELDGPFTIGDLHIVPVPVDHAGIETFGYRFRFPHGQSMAYLPDVKTIPASSLDLLQDLDVLIIDALRHTEHATHMSVTEALTACRQLRPGQAVFTHLSHEIDIDTIELPDNAILATDGLKLTFAPDGSCPMFQPSSTAPK